MGRQYSMKPSAIAARKYREKKAAKQAQIIEPTLVTDSPIKIVDNSQVASEENIEVDITPNESPKPSLKERLFGSLNGTTSQQKPKTAKKGQRGKQIDASLMSKVLPSMISGSIALYAQRLIKHPYKACAPTQQEVFGTIGPLFNILSRRIEIVGTASEDMIDLITALLTSLVTGIRIHITYMSIQEEIERAKHNDGHVINHGISKSHPFASTIGRDKPETTISGSKEVDTAIGVASNFSADASDGYADTADGNSVNAKREAEAVANLFKRDINGRTKLGLLAR